MNAPTPPNEPTPAWLQEWSEHQEWLRAMHDELEPDAAAPAAQREGLRLLPSAGLGTSVAAKAETPPVAAGQVRVLRPLPIMGAEDPRAVLVLGEGEDAGQWLCAPFSPLTVPAHDGEWRTPLAAEDPRLSVLCLWDATEVEETILAAARVMAAVAAPALAAALAVQAASNNGTPLPAGLTTSIGPEFSSLLDPRHEYEAEVGGALAAWAGLRSFSLQTSARRGAAKRSTISAAAESTLALAASPTGDQSLTASFALGETGLRLTVTPISPLEAQVMVKDAADQPSQLLAGGVLLFANGTTAAISAPELLLPIEQLAAGFAVADAHGAILPLS